jgi:hypothetical protein
MQEDPSRVVNFVWAGSDGQPRGSFAMAHNPKFESSTFIPGNITSLYYDLPGASGGFSNGNQTAAGLVLGSDVTKFWFEVTENGRKTLFDQNGAGFRLSGTTVLLAEGSCLLTIITDDANGFSETISLFVQIGVSRLVSATFLTPSHSLFWYYDFLGVEGCQSLERQCRALQLPSWQQHRRAGGVQPNRLGQQPAYRRVVRQHRSERIGRG